MDETASSLEDRAYLFWWSLDVAPACMLRLAYVGKRDHQA